MQHGRLSLNDAVPPGLKPRKLALGLLAFVTLTALGILAAGWLGGDALRFFDALRAMPAGFLLVPVVYLLVDFTLGGARLHLWLRILSPGARFSTSLKTYLVNLFAAALSPAGAASGPAQLAVLAREGVSPGRGFAGMLLTYVGSLSAVIGLAVLGAAVILRELSAQAGFSWVQLVLLILALVPAGFLMSLIARPALAVRFSTWVLSVGERLGGFVGRFLVWGGAKLHRAAHEYQAAIGAVKGRWMPMLSLSVGLSSAMYLNRALVAFLIAGLLGSDTGFIEIAARHSMQALFLYFMPSPGGGGVAEASVPAFMAGVIPGNGWLEFAVLWRGVTSYLGVAAGAIATLTVFKRGFTRHHVPKAGEVLPEATAGSSQVEIQG